MASSFENPFPEQKLEPIQRLFKIEKEFMANRGFFQNNEACRLRKTAVKKILLLSQNGGFDYDPFVPFLAVTYFDRCISRYPLLDDQHSYDLFVTSCVVLAWKMREERNRLDNVDHRQIGKMEHRIVYLLDWRIRSVTAVCFLDFFISFFKISDVEEIAAFKRQSLECKLLHMHYDAVYTEFKPSIIAATALIAERLNIAPLQTIFRCHFVDMDELENCLNLLTAQARKNEVTVYHLLPSPPLGAGSTHSAAATQEDEDEDEDEDEEEVEVDLRKMKRTGRTRTRIGGAMV